MICKVKLNLNPKCKGVLNLKYSEQAPKYFAELTFNNKMCLEKLLSLLRGMLSSVFLRVSYHNIRKEKISEFQEIIDKVFLESDINSIAVNIVKNHMKKFGKYPNFMDIDKAHAYIRNILGDIKDLDSIRLRVMYSN